MTTKAKTVLKTAHKPVRKAPTHKPAHSKAPAVVHAPKVVVKAVVEEKRKAASESRAVGRRKCASARVSISRGNGKITINGKPLNEYLPYFQWQEIVSSPLKMLAKDKDLDVSVKVAGGGKSGQAVAIRHGLTRALAIWNEDFKKTLKTSGFLTRDARVKERKKFGLKRARRAPQWSKR